MWLTDNTSKTKIRYSKIEKNYEGKTENKKKLSEYINNWNSFWKYFCWAFFKDFIYIKKIYKIVNYRVYISIY